MIDVSLKRITLVISSLHLGGAERVMASMANYWTDKGWPVSLITLNKEDHEQFYQINEAVDLHHVYYASDKPTLWVRFIEVFKRLSMLRSTIMATKPDIVISFLDKSNVRVLLAMTGLDIPVIVSERSNPYHMKLPIHWDWLRNVMYKRASCVVTQTKQAMSYFPDVIRNEGCIIPNHVSIPANADEIPVNTGQHHLVMGMGRLTQVKGFSRLIDAFAALSPAFSEWRLEIWGEGPERKALEAQVKSLAMEDRIRLPGKTHNAFSTLRQADIFVLSSHHEGFPNVLCEAMACGLAVISFDCHNGPGEIIHHGTDGILVPEDDVNGLGNAMARLMADDEERKRLGRNASDVTERFSRDRIMNRWEMLINSRINAVSLSQIK